MKRSIKICFISDTHGAKFHSKLEIPECDIVVHAGDIGGRTTTLELNEFLIWFEKLPARKKIWTAGNHDLTLDADWTKRQADMNVISGLIAKQLFDEGQKLIKNFDVVYLLNSGYEYEGLKFWGSPYSPSFHRQWWAFNADRGNEIKSHWDLIPNDTDVLITHGPPKGILDKCLSDGFNAGCEELNKKINEHQYPISVFGHIHEGYGFHWQNKTLCLNASVLNFDYVLTNKPFLVEIVIEDNNKTVRLLNI
jgi:Icc-related predicted phosphoesterase